MNSQLYENINQLVYKTNRNGELEINVSQRDLAKIIKGWKQLEDGIVFARKKNNQNCYDITLAGGERQVWRFLTENPENRRTVEARLFMSVLMRRVHSGDIQITSGEDE